MEGLQPIDILWNCINIVVLFLLLRMILWRPVSKHLANRAAAVRDQLDVAERTRVEAEALKAQYEHSIAEIEDQGRAILRDSQVRAGTQAKEITDNAQKQAERLFAEAQARIDAERREAVTSASREIAQLAAEMASQILSREVVSTDNLSAADEFFRNKTAN